MSRAASIIDALGHIGLFSGVYVAGAFVCLAQLGGVAVVPPPRAIGAITLLATAAYALDRVKLRGAWIDPADVASQPARYAFLQRHATAVRVTAFVMLVLGAALGTPITHWAPLAAVMIPVGVAVYAAKPRGTRARPKDVIAVKNGYVTAGIVGFTLVAAVCVAAPADTVRSWMEVARLRWVPLAAAAALLALRVYLDAALCDLDDEAADRRFGTATFATRMGSARAWRYTGVLRWVLVVAIAVATPCPWRARAAWSCMTLLGMLVLRLRGPTAVRDWVDLRLPVEACGATMVLWL